jgi:RecB family endonuclease NucS
MRIMPLYRYSVTGLEAVDRTTLAAAQIRERQDLQRVLRQRIDVLGDDLLVVAEEYGLFEDSRRRVDLLALDRKGTLVVIELKRTDDGGHMELQSLRYAAMVSTMTLEHLVNTYAEANDVDAQEARAAITGWVEEPFDELPNQVRIILVSADFSTEITSTVIWLNDT